MADLVPFLRGHPPFDALTDRDLAVIDEQAEVREYAPGEEVMDAFRAVTDAVWVVLTGQVELFAVAEPGPADEVLGRGGVFGYSALLSGNPVGPRAVALGPATVVRIPSAAVVPSFSSAAGVRFLANSLTRSDRTATDGAYGIVDQLVVTEPVRVPPTATVAHVAQEMTRRNCHYAVVDLEPTGFGLVTDAMLRSRVLAIGLPGDTPVTAVMDAPAPAVPAGTLAAQALVDLTDRHLECVLVVDRAGDLRGLVDRADFMLAPSTAGLSLSGQIDAAGDPARLVSLAGRLPRLVDDLTRRGRAVGEVTTVAATAVDALARRALALTLAAHPELDPAEITWLALGSNGRRETVPSSDVDAAVVFADTVTPERAVAYRAAFAEVGELLGRCGLSVDPHGAFPVLGLFSRTVGEWRQAAGRWRDEPLDDNGMMMTSLLLDARPVHGDPALPVVNDVFGDMRRHPGTMRLLLAESLSHRARLRSMRDVLARRGGTFDIKTHALRPVVDIARWAALAAGSSDLSTRARLAAAAGSAMMPDDQAAVLREVFDVLQRIRLRYQLAQGDRGEPPSDVLSLRRLSPLDRSLIGQAVREIATVQRRMSNLAQVTPPKDW
ncbi:cyclic nucleotide-binding domain-containing protein [Nakamurella flavida]|uniref:Cyclic nucleotide-binding domain-containing protein n=1 Tax=Nakamurella flavida TaxID=363630 RepID=A0A938YI55_9ACTN|nr:putative nucleotidyltransferase substrate binding domain-containing protein [Nakamurella flavida]MBM9478131.1 cyclic nucleotide-binding domain-containing protein [Nakamurella flavida]MDP9778647.1 CBS domain-containing protein [Nakamurella flavida]